MNTFGKLAVTVAAVPVLCLIAAIGVAIWPFTPAPVATRLDFSALQVPAPDRARWVEETYRARDGRLLFLRRVAGSTPLTVILVHGSGSEGRYLLPMAVHLMQATGAEVVIPDLRGHGRSGPVTGDVAYLGQLTDDLADLVEAIHARTPGARIVLGGHSSGGGLALRYAGTPALARVDAYLLLAPYLGYDAPTTRENSGAWVQVSIRRYASLMLLNTAGIVAFNHLPVLYFNRPAEWQDSLQAVSYTYRLNESLTPRKALQDLGRIDRPALVLVGERDESFYAQRFAEVFASHAPGVAVHLVAATGHLDLPNSAESLATVASWLRDHNLTRSAQADHENR